MQFIPLSPEEITRSRPRVQQIKEDKFDESLTTIVNNRAIQLAIVEASDRARLATILLPTIREHVDVTVLEIIFHENPLHYHDCCKNKTAQLLYRAEDTLRKLSRELIEEAYNNDIPNEIRRKKVVGCINAVCCIVNSEDFYRALSRRVNLRLKGKRRRR